MAFLDDVFDTQRLERINAEAREVHAGKALLTIIAAVLFGLGWVAARTFGVLWLVVAWSWTAVRLGWQEGRRAQHRKR